MPQNCWEFKKCGRGVNSAGKGKSICPTAMATEFHGANHGTNGGRYCWMVGGTYCEGCPQTDFAYKEVNCILCDFYHLVHDEEGKDFRDGESVLKLASKEVKAILKQAVLDAEPLELQLDDQPRIFFSQLMDDIPPSVETSGENGETTLEDPLYEAGFYVENGSHLLIFPTNPSLGNALIRRSEKIMLRFYHGIKAVEAEVEFLGIAHTRDETGLRLSFPERLKLYRQRRFRRFAFPPEFFPRLTISKGTQVCRAMTCLDMSPCGIGFKVPAKDNFLNINDTVHLDLIFDSMEAQVSVNGYLRNMDTGLKLADGKTGIVRCGVQFDIVDMVTEAKIQEVVLHLQRAHLRRMKESRSAQTRGVSVQPGHDEAIKNVLRSKAKFFDRLF